MFEEFFTTGLGGTLMVIILLGVVSHGVAGAAVVLGLYKLFFEPMIKDSHSFISQWFDNFEEKLQNSHDKKLIEDELEMLLEQALSSKSD